ncbi:MAG: hypothetical protein AB8B91_15075 [Rubripirellula sp.]
MLKKILLAFVLMFGLSLMLAQDASADHCNSRSYRGGYGVPVYAAPVVSYRAPLYGHGYYGRGYSSRSFYGGHPGNYRSGYRGYSSFYGSPYGYGGYGRGTSIGIGRGGVSLNFGF